MVNSVVWYFEHILMLPRLPLKICFESEGRPSYYLTKVNHRDFGGLRIEGQDIVGLGLKRVSTLFGSRNKKEKRSLVACPLLLWSFGFLPWYLTLKFLLIKNNYINTLSGIQLGTQNHKVATHSWLCRDGATTGCLFLPNSRSSEQAWDFPVADSLQQPWAVHGPKLHSHLAFKCHQS